MIRNIFRKIASAFISKPQWEPKPLYLPPAVQDSIKLNRFGWLRKPKGKRHRSAAILARRQANKRARAARRVQRAA